VPAAAYEIARTPRRVRIDCEAGLVTETTGGASNAAGAKAFFKSHAPRFIRWLALLFVASLFVPALTKQWSDRKQELQVKEELATSISSIVADAIYGAEAAESRPSAGKEQLRHDVIHTWLRDRAAVEPRLSVYFGGSDAASWWFESKRIGYRNAVLVFAHLACCDATQRKVHVRWLRKFVGDGTAPPASGGDPWRALSCEPERTCGGTTHSVAYRWLGNQLLYQRQAFLEDLLVANGSGFSTGWRDFVHDLFPLR
jgi:hypothetical protein